MSGASPRSSEQPLPPALQENAADHAAKLLRGGSGLIDKVVPGAGSIFAELVGVVIPGQRNERLIEYVAAVARRYRELAEGSSDLTDRLERAEASLGQMDQELRQLAHALTPEQVALFEDGAFASVKATSADRIQRLGRIVAEGLSADDLAARRERSVVGLIAQLTEDDVIRLCSFVHPYNSDPSWLGKHRSVVDPSAGLFGTTEAGDPTWTAAAYDAEIQGDIQLRKLIGLGLVRQHLEPRLQDQRGGQGLKVSLETKAPEITQTGTFVLRRLGLGSS